MRVTRLKLPALSTPIWRRNNHPLTPSPLKRRRQDKQPALGKRQEARRTRVCWYRRPQADRIKSFRQRGLTVALREVLPVGTVSEWLGVEE
jgi:hypothetical protein